MNPTGASFGWSTNAGDLCLAAAAAFVTKMPVALSMTYEEHQHFSGKRCPAYSNGRLACDENGMFTAAEFDFGMDHGAYSWGGDDLLTKPARFTYWPYYVPDIAGLVRIANTNHNFATAYRGYGSPQAYTHSEAMIDMLARKIGMDPFEIRWKNIAREGQTNTNSYAALAQHCLKLLKIHIQNYLKNILIQPLCFPAAVHLHSGRGTNLCLISILRLYAQNGKNLADQQLFLPAKAV